MRERERDFVRKRKEILRSVTLHGVVTHEWVSKSKYRDTAYLKKKQKTQKNRYDASKNKTLAITYSINFDPTCLLTFW